MEKIGYWFCLSFPLWISPAVHVCAVGSNRPLSPWIRKWSRRPVVCNSCHRRAPLTPGKYGTLRRIDRSERAPVHIWHTSSCRSITHNSSWRCRRVNVVKSAQCVRHKRRLSSCLQLYFQTLWAWWSQCANGVSRCSGIVIREMSRGACSFLLFYWIFRGEVNQKTRRRIQKKHEGR